MNTDDSTLHGLIILRASRLEALVAPLHDLLQKTRPAQVLAPQTVIAAHPGMKTWLTGALARHLGPGRVVANLDVQLPSTWLDGLSSALLGARAVALPQYRRAHLRWTLHGLLGDPARHGVTDPRVAAYLDGAASADEAALRRVQLADRLSRVFSQYLVYRPDWLEAWEAGTWPWATAPRAGRVADPALRSLEGGLLGPLWRTLVRRLGDHRGRLMKTLSDALGATPDPLPPLHVFGLSHLPPVELALLRRYAQAAPVILYVPDPCREYWGGLDVPRGGRDWRVPDPAAWDRFRHDEAQRLDHPDALDWHAQGHPLLARWGRLGQHFFAALAEGEIREDIRHWQDEETPAPANRLERLQDSLRRLQPALLREDVGAAGDGDDDAAARLARERRHRAACADASLRIHACHTRQRELEVLRDALLDAIDTDGVRPGDIVVMAPDIQAYLPLIPAVFGQPGSVQERLLPYHLADVPVARSHPLFTVLTTLLGIGAARVTAPEVVDLLAVAEVRRALALDADAADTLVEWLQGSRVAWALDGAHKQALSLPARPEFSFAWAMDRLLAGYLMADPPGAADPAAVALPDDTELLPMAGIEGPSAAALGSLDRLLCELQAWRDLARLEQPASAWAEALRTRVDALMRVDPGDADAVAALSVIHRAIANLAAEPARNNEDPSLRLAVVRELLQDALAAAPERQRFLMGGITVCGMVPQRAIPFDVVCVLGLDEGAFPRRPSDGGVDLMARIRRIGDRDVPSDDRYLFLETVMSARKRLHLSYIGQGVRDGGHRNPAAPLAELMAELETQCGIAPEDGNAPRPWLVRHPLQPFDARYFSDAHPALFSYSRAFAAMRGEGRRALPRLRDGGLPAPEALPDPLPLAALEGFFKDPAKALLKDHLQLSLDALDDDARLPDAEPMQAIPRLHAVARRVFLQHVLPRKCRDPEWAWDRQAPAWVRLGGLLPLGAAGDAAWEAEAAAVDALWSQADACGRFDARGQHGGQAVRVDLPLLRPGDAADDTERPQRITGLLRNVFPLHGSQDGVQVVFAYPDSSKEKSRLKDPTKLNFKDRVPAFLHWALLRLQRAGSASPAPVRLTMLAEGEPDLAAQVNAWDAHYCATDAVARASMDADLRRRLRALIGCLHRGREGLSWFHPKSGWAALQALQKASSASNGSSDAAEPAMDHTDGVPASGPETDDAAQPALAASIAKAVANVWVAEYGDATGERDYAPGYAQLLEGDLVFGDPETDPDRRALRALIEESHAINALILLGDDSIPNDGAAEASA